jgi:hypothetical protein
LIVEIKGQLLTRWDEASEQREAGAFGEESKFEQRKQEIEAVKH